MLNKELLMVGSEFLDSVLPVYISSDIRRKPGVSGTLSSGELFSTIKAGEPTSKFSEAELTASSCIEYDEDTQLSTSNLMPKKSICSL